MAINKKYSPLVQKILKRQKLVVKDRKYAHIKGIKVDHRVIRKNIGTGEKPMYEKTNEPVSSLALTRNTTVPLLRNGQCVGSWENGLTKKEIDFLSSAGIPRIDENTDIPYYDGLMFDLTKPHEVAYFNVLMATNVIAPNEEMLGDRRYYLEFSDKVRFKKNKNKEDLKAVLTLDKKLTPVEKRQLLYVINFSQPIDSDIRIDAMSDEDVTDSFGDICMDLEFTSIILKKATGAGKTIGTEALLCKAIEKNVLYLDVQGRIFQSHGDGRSILFASDYDEALSLLTKNSEVSNRIVVLTSDLNYQTMSMSDTPKSILDELYSTDDEKLNYDDIKYEEIDFLDIKDIQGFIEESNGYEQIKPRIENVVELDDWKYWGRIAFASKLKSPQLMSFFKDNEGVMFANKVKMPKMNSRMMVKYDAYVQTQDIIHKELYED